MRAPSAHSLFCPPPLGPPPGCASDGLGFVSPRCRQSGQHFVCGGPDAQRSRGQPHPSQMPGNARPAQATHTMGSAYPGGETVASAPQAHRRILRTGVLAGRGRGQCSTQKSTPATSHDAKQGHSEQSSCAGRSELPRSGAPPSDPLPARAADGVFFLAGRRVSLRLPVPVRAAVGWSCLGSGSAPCRGRPAISCWVMGAP